ncbi:unnamed protein product [Clonostachys byssicola]|uniref:RxLR effector protein n=1 Tax=Clonostachys byssicola TaxID=160290 RepID=A0A9N9UQP6_9HYPO|nr:unnamed protein product [Clonostachys byssicola]
MVCLNRLSVSAILLLNLSELAAAAPIAIREATIGESTQMAARNLKNPIVGSRDNLEQRSFEMLEERDGDDIGFILRDVYTDEIDIDTRAPLGITKLIKTVVAGGRKDLHNLDNMVKVHNNNVKKNQAANKKVKRHY